jgi:hypothetical protein
MPLTTVNPALLDTQAQYTGFKNRIINGAMVIDQRNGGASVTIPSTTGSYTLDRWATQSIAASKYTVQRNAGSVTPPVGFSNYLGATVAASANVTVGASDYYGLIHVIEGFNVADLGWGAAGAQSVTLSFLVRSSLTGTFGGALRNGGGTRSYPFTYTISSANTWEQKSITVAGDTSGTWATDNTGGLIISFGLGYGTTFSGTAGAWASANFISATGAVRLIETNNATFYVTGVQLEKGSTATSFDYRPYGTELYLCQRYFQSYPFTGGTIVTTGVSFATNAGTIPFNFIVPMRVAPTTVTLPTVGTGNGQWTILTTAGGFPGTLGTIGASTSSTVNLRLDATGYTGNFSGGGQAMFLYASGSTTTTVTLSAEL